MNWGLLDVWQADSAGDLCRRVSRRNHLEWQDEDEATHCIEGPAIVNDRGDQLWYLHGKQHRLDGPACEWADGTLMWYVDGMSHRTDGPARIYSGGQRQWHCNGLLHRENGPAMEYEDGSYLWYKHGHLHRQNGPAVFWARSNRVEYWVDGVKYSYVGCRFLDVEEEMNV